MEKNKNVPKLRFPEFSGEWEEKKLGEINVEIIDGDRGKKYPNDNDFFNEGYCLFLNAKNVTKNGFLFENTTFISKEKDDELRKGKLQRHDIVLTTRGSIGNIAYYNDLIVFDNLRINSGMVLIRSNGNVVLPNYLYKFLNSDLVKIEIKKISFGSAQPQLTVALIDKIQVAYPSLSEQTKIASFLTAVDEKLTQLKKKKTLLEQYKKGIMQKLFSQELRFKDNNNQDFPDWQEKTLGQIAELTSSKRVYLSDYVNEGIPFYRGKEISELKQNIQPKEILFISEKAYNDFKANYGVPSINDILITAVGTLGNVLKIRDNNPFYFKDGNLIWLKKINQNSDFLEYLLHVKHNEIENSAIGSSQKALTMVELRKLSFSFPSLPEQQKIATFLSSIDEKINHSSKQVEKMEAWKKGLLQQMFC